MKCLILLCLVAGAFAFLDCPANQHYDSCGSACPLTCNNYKNPPKACVLMCVPGCHCDAGYVKNEQGECVMPEQCPNQAPKSCGQNERYNSCGTDCPLTCENYLDAPLVCDFMCKIGCECDEGYVRSADGRCVLPQNCPAKSKNAESCGQNEHFNRCGTDCPLTCRNYENPPTFCNLMCKIGCECDEGYVRSADGRCVLPQNCPAKSNNAVKSCFGEPDTGLCKMYITSWYYDVKYGSCYEFVYGGCGGTGNRYATQDECMENCGGIKHGESSSDVCDLPVKKGVCLAYIPRYFYNKESGKCEKFIYGGCGGNGNNFRTLDDCQKSCQQKEEMSVCGENERYNGCGTFCPLTCENYQNPPMICPAACKIGCECEEGYVRARDGRCVLPENCPAQALNRPDCDQKPEVGMCRASFKRFYYDQEAGMCKTFIYGGCGGNRNNFETEFDCYNKCGALSAPQACHQPKEVGPCRGAFPRYAFNPATGKCEYFIYGGCGGNDNNFSSPDDCETVCLNNN